MRARNRNKSSLGSALSKDYQTLDATFTFQHCFFLQCKRTMKRRIIWLAAASITYGSPHVFSVGDDLLAYPQVSRSRLRARCVH